MSARNCTGWWSSEDGRCSDDDTGAGRHACRLTDTGLGSDQERVHSTCECRCGATAKRPEPTLPEDLTLGCSGPDAELLDRGAALAVLLDLPSNATWDSIEAAVRALQAKAGEQP